MSARASKRRYFLGAAAVLTFLLWAFVVGAAMWAAIVRALTT